MRLLTEEERLKIDTKPDVIEKWDKFLKKAVYNLGYGSNIIDNMYPYDRGLPMKGTDERLPVGPTGRIFFKMSNADKLAQMFSVITRTGDVSATKNVSYFLNHFLEDEATWNLLYPEEKMPDTDEERKQKFIEDCNIFQILTNYVDSVAHTRWLKEDEKEQFITGNGNREQSLAFMLFFKPWEEDYSSSLGTKIRNHFEYAIQNTLNGYNISTEMYTKLIKNSEVYAQDYLVLSLNPIDKLMLSTKQAFGSCMSIAKQCDTSGTNSGPAFGLPAMFNTDSVWLTFMTPGKHKNMYWEKVEWEKQPEDRDPEKAYKYLKMTCRALTYQGKMSYANSYKSLKSYESLEPDKDKLFVGRQYSANGEDFTWQKMIEVIMARYGIATAHAYVEELGTKLNMPASNVLNKGILSGRAPITFDRFGQVRGYYYDNLRIHLKSYVTTDRSMVQDNFKRGYKLEDNVEVSGDTEIQTGSSRSGSGGIASYYNPKPGLDMFKMMLGEQNYSYLNLNVRICSKCGEVIEKVAGTDKNNEPVCMKCAEKLELKICLHCNRLYSEDEADEHKEVNLAELMNDDPERKVKPVIVCKSLLRQASVDQSDTGQRVQEKVICGHCGKITNMGSMPYSMRGYHDTMTYEDVTFKVAACYECFSKAYICDKCKKLIFIETNQDAALLLPNRRVICKDCIDSIRIKKERREEIRSVLNNILDEDVPETSVSSTEVEFTEDYLLKNTTKRILSQYQNFNKSYGTGKFKDVMKQFKSWVQAHPGKYMHIKPVEAPKEAPIISEELVERVEEYIF